MERTRRSMQESEPNVGGSEMASREKRPLAPSKAKQKANNESISPIDTTKSKKGKALSNVKQQQISRNILDAVATGSQLPAKLEAILPRKKALETALKRKHKLAAKTTFSKVKQKVPIKSIKRLAEGKKSLHNKRKKPKAALEIEIKSLETVENHQASDVESFKSLENSGKATKNIVKTTKKSLKASAKAGDADSAGGQDKSPKSGRKTVEAALKTKTKASVKNRNESKEREVKISESEAKNPKAKRSLSKEPDPGSANDNSIESTIEEVIASMITDSEEETGSISDTDLSGVEHQTANRKKKRLPTSSVTRNLRNGKIRSFSESVPQEIGSLTNNMESKSFSSETASETKNVLSMADDGESAIKEITSNHITNTAESASEVENNNNGGERLNDIYGPTLRSKMKARCAETDANKINETKVDSKTEVKVEETKAPVSKSNDVVSDEIKKPITFDFMRKRTLPKFAEKSKSPRNILNIDMKKTVESFYEPDKTDGTHQKLPIDKMIETIKLNIAKSIENKLYRPEKGLNKHLELPKTEDSVAPSKTNAQQLAFKENTDTLEQTETSKQDVESEISDSSVPKVADTAKEIEMLVMGDVELEKTHSQQDQDQSASHENDEVTSQVKLLDETKEDKVTQGTSQNQSFDKEKEDIKQVTVTRKSPRNLNKAHQENNSDSIKSPQKTMNDETDESEGSEPKHDFTENNATDNTASSEAIKCDKKDQSPTKIKEAINVKEVDPKKDEFTQELEPVTNVEQNSDLEASKSEAVMETVDTTDSSSILTELRSLEDEETLESLSLEVEKLVSEDNLIKDSTNESVQNDEEMEIAGDNISVAIENSELSSEIDIVLEDNILQSAESASQETMEVSPSAEITSTELELAETTSSEIACDEGAKNTNHVLTDNGCESNIESSEQNVPEVTNEIKDIEKNFPSTATDKIEQKPIIITKQSESTNDSCDEIESPDKVDEVTPISTVTDDTNPVRILEDAILIQENHEEKSDTSNVSEDVMDENIAIDEKLIIKDEQLEIREVCGENLIEEFVSSETKSEEVPNQLSENVISSKDIKAETATLTEVESTDATKQTEIPKSNEVAPSNKEAKASMETRVTENAKVLEVCDQRKTEEFVETTAVDENRRVLRARDRSRKVDSKPTAQVVEKSISISDISSSDTSKLNASPKATTSQSIEHSDSLQTPIKTDIDATPEPQIRTRRSRDVKKPVASSAKSKRTRKSDVKKTDQQKEETLLDNEVAKINENTSSINSSESCRGFSADSGHSKAKKDDTSSEANRSKSENDIQTMEGTFSHSAQAEVAKDSTVHESEIRPKTLEKTLKESDNASTSGESSSSASTSLSINETPEEKRRKEFILRILGLETSEQAQERLMKSKREQSSGTLKTVIRVQKDKDTKKRSRSPLKIVFKQGRTDGEESPDFYTIQKELGPGGMGESSSGANRKLSTNHRVSCDEDGEDAPKDRQSLVIPEKSSSFSIHPGRLCADVCCYCFGKFGTLDTPMHLAQMKSDDRRKKILAIEVHLTKDSCLCDACYRHVDRKANTSPTNVQAKPQRQHRQLLATHCSARNCPETSRHHVKRRWLVKIKNGLRNELDVNWESSQHSSMPFCASHYATIERLLTCALCSRRLIRNHASPLLERKLPELNQRLVQQGIPITLQSNTFVCKLCKYFTHMQMKEKDLDSMTSNHKTFAKNYKKRILCNRNLQLPNMDDEEEAGCSTSTPKEKEKARKRLKGNPSPKMMRVKSPETGNNSTTSDKSTPEPTIRNEETVCEPVQVTTKHAKLSPSVEVPPPTAPPPSEVRYVGSIECAIEELKKRKCTDTTYTTTRTDGSGTDVVEILAMDKEVTLTRLPKKPRLNNDITPVVQRLGANPSISVRTLFPGEEEMNLHANVEFGNVREVTPHGWEKCATIIQYDNDTKMLWQELQRPYGNQSSFLRHLILLEKYYRAGDLVLAPNASRNAINYSTSVQNRLISYEGPEKVDEPIMEPISNEFNNSRRLSGGYVLERDRLSLPSTSTATLTSAGFGIHQNATPTNAKTNPAQRVLKLTPGVSIIKKPPPNLQRLNLPSTSGIASNGGQKRKGAMELPRNSVGPSGGKVFQLTEPDFKRLQSLKRQKMLTERRTQSPNNAAAGSSAIPSTSNAKSVVISKAQTAVAHTQFQKHVRMQQEMLNRQSRGDFEPLICDVRTLNANENSPTQNLLQNLNLPKSIHVSTKPSNLIPILPKIPKSLTVIPQTVPRPFDK